MRIVIRWNSSCRVFKNTTAEGVATEREREYTYWHSYLSPPLYSSSTHPDWTQMPQKTLQKRGCNKIEKDQPTTNNKKVPFQKQNRWQNVWELRTDKTRGLDCWVVILNSNTVALHQRGEEGIREYTLTAIHICHRTRTPFWHVLIERFC